MYHGIFDAVTEQKELFCMCYYILVHKYDNQKAASN